MGASLQTMAWSGVLTVTMQKKKANYKPGKMMQIEVQDSCLLMPSCRMH